MILDEEQVKAKQLEEEKRKMSLALRGETDNGKDEPGRFLYQPLNKNKYYFHLVKYVIVAMYFFASYSLGEENIRPKSGKSARSMRNARRLSSIKSAEMVLDKDYYQYYIII